MQKKGQFITNSTSQNQSGRCEQKIARLPKTEPIPLHSENPDYVENAIKRIGPALEKICQMNHWHIDALKARFDPKYFPNASSFSRLINNDFKRMPSSGKLLDMRRVAGLSLDKLADSNIGINKMLQVPGCSFVLYVGNKKLVKRQEFERFIKNKLSI